MMIKRRRPMLDDVFQPRSHWPFCFADSLTRREHWH
jgi:hypothetical protein